MIICPLSFLLFDCVGSLRFPSVAIPGMHFLPLFNTLPPHQCEESMFYEASIIYYLDIKLS